MTCEPFEMLAVKMCLSTPTSTQHRVRRFYEKLKESVILSHASQQDLVLVRKKSLSNSDDLSQSTLKSCVQEQGFWCGTTAAFCI